MSVCVAVPGTSVAENALLCVSVRQATAISDAIAPRVGQVNKRNDAIAPIVWQRAMYVRLYGAAIWPAYTRSSLPCNCFAENSLQLAVNFTSKKHTLKARKKCVGLCCGDLVLFVSDN